jgi:hypothetical protein
MEEEGVRELKRGSGRVDPARGVRKVNYQSGGPATLGIHIKEQEQGKRDETG